MLQFFEKLKTIHSVKYSSSSKSPDEAKEETGKTKANDAASATDPEGKPSTLFDTTRFKDAVIKGKYLLFLISLNVYTCKSLK